MSDTDLDFTQVIRKVYDATNNALKTTTTAVVSGVQEVVISHTDDSIKIGDGTTIASVLASAPASDTGQAAIAVRVISQLGAGTGGGATGGLTNTELRATPVPVSGTVAVTGAYQATQPVSGTVSVSNLPSSQAVTGSFYQATQPVSIASMPTTAVTGPLTDTQLRASAVPVSMAAAPTGAATSALQTTGNNSLSAMDTKTPALGQALAGASVPVVLTAAQMTTLTPLSSVSVSNLPSTQAVTGTFFQTTQPVSIASMPSTPVTGTFWQTTQPVSGSFFQATQPVSIATMPSTPVTGTFWQATQPVSGPLTDTQIRATALPVSGAVTVTQASLTKGTQGATGVTTQDLKDAGRNQTNYYMAIQIVTTATDALMSLTGYKSGAAVVATTTPAVVTAGKTYRITSATMDYTTIVTTPGSSRFTLRANTGGLVAITSPAVAIWEVGEPTGVAPVAGKKNTITIPFPDGIEFPAGTGIGLSHVGLGATGAAAIVGYGRLTLTGYEY